MRDLELPFREVLWQGQVFLRLWNRDGGLDLARYAKSSAISAANSFCTT